MQAETPTFKFQKSISVLQIAAFSNKRSIYFNFFPQNVTQGLTPQAEAEAEDSTYFRDLLSSGHEIHSYRKQQGKMYLTRCKAECKEQFQFNAWFKFSVILSA